MAEDLLKRYERGQHAEVWRELGAVSALASSDAVAEAHAVGRATMARVRRNAETLSETLAKRGFALDFPPGEDAARATRSVGEPVPAAVIAARLARWAPLPAALQAFWEIVGHLNFIGSPGDGAHAWPDAEQLDPLHIYSPFAVVHERDDGRLAAPLIARASGASLESRLAAMFAPDEPEQDEAEDLDPEHIVITLDGCMKMRVGGAGPIVARTGLTADAALFFEGAPLRDDAGRPGVTFVSYLRRGFACGGFFGLDPERNAKLVATLTRGLEPF